MALPPHNTYIRMQLQPPLYTHQHIRICHYHIVQFTQVQVQCLCQWLERRTPLAQVEVGYIVSVDRRNVTITCKVQRSGPALLQAAAGGKNRQQQSPPLARTGPGWLLLECTLKQSMQLAYGHTMFPLQALQKLHWLLLLIFLTFWTLCWWCSTFQPLTQILHLHVSNLHCMVVVVVGCLWWYTYIHQSANQDDQTHTEIIKNSKACSPKTK